jgi:predicted nucleotidyltransferase|tara:strand:+ start:244 stop:516 length:273 start_codon:yes stop_codon:yes gene_type:complete
MTYKEFLEALEEIELDISSAAEALDLEVSEINSWKNEEEIPDTAVNWVKSEKVELAALKNTNEDDDFTEEEELELDGLDEDLALEKDKLD